MPVLPDGLGVNIHFTDAKPGEMKMLADGGFRWVRMDFAWDGTEREKGKYDFSAYDRLMKSLDEHKIRALFILDYSNRHYDGGLSPQSDEGRRAFAQWAAAAAKHFQGRGILWEMYNEPNIFFWRPKPDVNQYVKLALEVGKALREAAPGEAYIGPATSQVDMAFLEACFKAGLLKYWCGVSVHPYRQEAPETTAADYAKLRRLIARYAPQGKKIPILSGEWGYSAVWKNYDPVRQGKYLPRQFMTNLLNDVPLSIWYDWHDDGTDAKEPEHHFGTVEHAYRAGRDPVYEPKPAYRAAKTLAAALGGYRFSKRLAVGGADDYVLLFAKGDDVRVAAWTIAREPHAVVIPASPGKFAATAHTGEPLPALIADGTGPSLVGTSKPPSEIAADAKGLLVTLTDAPQYLVPEKPNELLRKAEAREQSTLEVTLLPPSGKTLTVRVESTFGEAGAYTVTLTDLGGLKPVAATQALTFRQGEWEKTLQFSLKQPAAATCWAGVRIENDRGKLVARVPATAFRSLDDFATYSDDALAAAYKLVADGDAKVASTQSLSLGTPPASAESPTVSPATSLRITYGFEKGWKFVRLVPQKDALKKIDGRPTALGLWLYGDGSGNLARLRFTDSTGQTFQPNGEPIQWKGWRYIVFPLDGRRGGHWGGANDGTVHYPIRLDTLLLIDSAGQQKTQGEVYLAAPTLISTANQ
jgi:hypothetical protein